MPPAALAEVAGEWRDDAVKKQILELMADGFKIIHMAREKRRIDYVAPSDPQYTLKQFQTNSGDEQLVTYLARM